MNLEIIFIGSKTVLSIINDFLFVDGKNVSLEYYDNILKMNINLCFSYNTPESKTYQGYCYLFDESNDFNLKKIIKLHKNDLPYFVISTSNRRMIEKDISREVNFYGLFNLHDIDKNTFYDICIRMTLTPIHLIWNSSTNSLTWGCQSALTRIFWLLDKDQDTLLCEEELIQWFNLMDSSFSSEFHNIYLPKICHDKDFFIENKLTLSGFISIIDYHIEKEKIKSVWSLFYKFNIIPASFPFSNISYEKYLSPYSTSLSDIAINFFQNIFQNKSKINIWSFTPICPWIKISGVLSPEIISTVDDFIEAWEAVCCIDPISVVLFAIIWGFLGNIDTLLNYDKSSFSTTLLLGSQGSGKSSLIQYLYNQKSSSMNRRIGENTVSIYLDKKTKFNRIVEIPSHNIDTLVYDYSSLQHFSIILCLIDSSDSHSFGYSAHKILSIKKIIDIPILFVLTKADLPFIEPIYSTTPELFCKKHNLLWPPIITSVVDKAIIGFSNELPSLISMLNEVSEHPHLCKNQKSKKIFRKIFIYSLFTLSIFFLIKNKRKI